MEVKNKTIFWETSDVLIDGMSTPFRIPLISFIDAIKS
jgi:hypothetical protein